MARAVIWSKEEEKAFENAIALHWTDEEDDSKDTWRKIADLVPSKSLADLRLHFQMLVDDVCAIEAGSVPVPSYVAEEMTSSSNKDSPADGGFGNGGSGFGRDAAKGSKADQERKKGIPWSEEEHRLFLLGLDKFGKGDWRSISRNFVVSRTPTQVASHAQKYFIRMNSMKRERRRSSIHDITSLSNGETSSQITGLQASSAAGVAPPAVGHPVAAPHGHIPSAVGTPVMLPSHPPPYLIPVAYPVPAMPPPPMQGGSCVAR